MAEKKARWFFRVAVVGCGGLIALGMVGLLILYLARGVIASWYVTERLSEAGIVCSPAISLEPSGDLTSAEVSPTRCTLRDGPIASVSLPNGAVATMSGTILATIAATRLDVELRERTATPLTIERSEWMPSLPWNEEEIVRSLASLGALSERELPDADVGQLVVSRGGRALAVMESASVRRADVSTVLRARTGSLSFGAALRLSDLELALEHDTLRASASVLPDAGSGGLLGLVVQNLALPRFRTTVVIEGLRTERPVARLGLEIR